MKRIVPLCLLAALALLPSSGRTATNLVNDGTTALGLERLANEFNALGFADTTLTEDPGGFLVAAQSPDLAYPPLRTVWYSLEAVPTNALYRVAVDFRPAAASPLHRGGVMGWLDVAARTGIVLKLDPSAPATLQLSVVSFGAESPEDNESVNRLFNLDGTPAAAETGSAWLELPTSYTATNFATLDLDFTAPAPADLAALSNATARITARLLQSPGGTNPPIQLGEPLELLTDLPLPHESVHRFGYFAVWSAITPGEAIGDVDNLTASGGVARPPVVSVIRPAEGAQYRAPATLVIEAEARDTDGTVTRVEFFNNGVPLGSATVAPYVFTWTNSVPGTYQLTARATDNLGLRALSSPVEITVLAPPVVGLVAPEDGASFASPATLGLEADATDADGTVTAVDFYAGTELLGSDTAAPYRFNWSQVPLGTYALTARATDNSGLISTSAPITVRVSIPPSIAITNPAPGATFREFGTIVIRASASDTDGSVAGVNFFAGAQLLGSVANAPYEFAWTNVPAGAHQLTAQATDDLGVKSTSLPVDVVVIGGPLDRPNITLTMTTNGFRLSWASPGFQLQFRSSFLAGSWANWPSDTTGLTGVTIPFDLGMRAQFFQLVGAGAPAAPGLTVTLSPAGTVTVSWPSSVTGYKLQTKPTLDAPAWTDVATTGNTYSEPATARSRFFRLAPL